MFEVYNTGDLTLDGLTITGGDANNLTDGYNGGGIAVYGSAAKLYVNDSTISNNYASGDGGGIYNHQGSVNIYNGSSVDNNEALGNGGGIFNSGNYADVTIDGSSVDGNEAALNGGGIYNEAGGDVVVTNFSTVDSNIAGSNDINGMTPTYYGGSGGGIFNTGVGSTVEVFDSDVNSNDAVSGPVSAGPTFGGGDGGGIYNVEGTVSLQGINMDLRDNLAQYRGGGVFNKGTLSISNIEIYDNQSGVDFASAPYNATSNTNYGGYGGGIFNFKGYYAFTSLNPQHGGNTANLGNIGLPGTLPGSPYDFIYPAPQPTARIAVTTAFDIVDAPDTSSFQALLADPGADGSISLREAVIAANNQSVDVFNNQPGGTSTYTDYISIDVGATAASLYYAGYGIGYFYGAYNSLLLSQNSGLAIKDDTNSNATLDLVVYISNYGSQQLGSYTTHTYDTAIVDATGNSSIFKLQENAGAAFYDLTLQNGFLKSANGGALNLADDSYAVLDNVTVTGSGAQDGGGIYVSENAQLYLTNDADGNNIFTGPLGRVAGIDSYSTPTPTMTPGGVGIGAQATPPSPTTRPPRKAAGYSTTALSPCMTAARSRTTRRTPTAAASTARPARSPISPAPWPTTSWSRTTSPQMTAAVLRFTAARSTRSTAPSPGTRQTAVAVPPRAVACTSWIRRRTTRQRASRTASFTTIRPTTSDRSRAAAASRTPRRKALTPVWISRTCWSTTTWPRPGTLRDPPPLMAAAFSIQAICLSRVPHWPRRRSTTIRHRPTARSETSASETRQPWRRAAASSTPTPVRWSSIPPRLRPTRPTRSARKLMPTAVAPPTTDWSIAMTSTTCPTPPMPTVSRITRPSTSAPRHTPGRWRRAVDSSTRRARLPT